MPVRQRLSQWPYDGMETCHKSMLPSLKALVKRERYHGRRSDFCRVQVAQKSFHYVLGFVRTLFICAKGTVRSVTLIESFSNRLALCKKLAVYSVKASGKFATKRRRRVDSEMIRSRMTEYVFLCPG